MTAASVTDPNGDYPIKPGAFVGFDYSTTALRGGVMLVASPNGKDKIPKLGPDGLFMFSIADGDNMWLLLKDKVQSVLGKVTWDSITGKPDVATKANVATVAEVANNALNKANSNEAVLAGKANKTDLTWDNVSGKPIDLATVENVAEAQNTADSALSKANSNATALNSKVNKSDLTWANITGKPDVATKANVATVAEVANNALNKANSNEAVLAGKANKTDLTWDNVSGKPIDLATVENVAEAQNTADSALSKANSNATALNSKVNKSDLTWANIAGKPSIPDADDTTTVSSGDLNSYTTTGKYYMPNSLSNYTNHPTTGTDMGDWFVMKVDSYHNGDMIIQTIYQINSGDVWIRQHWVNSWKAWRQVTFWPKGG